MNRLDSPHKSFSDKYKTVHNKLAPNFQKVITSCIWSSIRVWKRWALVYYQAVIHHDHQQQKG